MLLVIRLRLFLPLERTLDDFQVGNWRFFLCLLKLWIVGGVELLWASSPLKLASVEVESYGLSLVNDKGTTFVGGEVSPVRSLHQPAIVSRSFLSSCKSNVVV